MTHPLMEWLVVWAVHILTNSRVRPCERTAYQTTTGSRARGLVFGFPERACFNATLEKIGRGRFDSHGAIGHVACITMRICECSLASTDAVHVWRSVRRTTVGHAYTPGCRGDAHIGCLQYTRGGA